jgi:hypothetical protein
MFSQAFPEFPSPTRSTSLASPPGTEPIEPGRQPIQAKGTPQRVPPLCLDRLPPHGKAHRIARPTESREIPRFFKLGRAFRVCYTQPMNGLGIEMRRLGWQGRSLHFRAAFALVKRRAVYLPQKRPVA